MIVVHQVIAQQVVRMVIAIHAQVLTDQPVVHTVTEIPVRHRVHLLIGENVVTAHVIHDHLQIVPIVRHVLMVIDQNAVMIVVQVPIDQQVVRMVIAIPVQVPVHLPIVVIVQLVAHMVIVIPVQVLVHLPIVVIAQQVAHTETEIHVQVPIVHAVARRVDRQIDAMIVILDRAIHDPRQINPAEATHTVAIAHAQAMTATRVRLRVTANAVAVQIAPEAAFPMIAKSVHAVALAKSA